MPNTKPYPFQKECAFQIERFGGRPLVAADPGLGKSLISLLWARWNPDIRPIVIVCPASLKWNWEDQAYMHFGERCVILSTTKASVDQTKTSYKIIIINYDILKPWMSVLQNLDPQLVIIDECHYLINRNSLRTRMVRKLCNGVPHVIALSGTPLLSKTKELWPILNILNPREFSNYYSYCHEFTNASLSPWGWKFEGARNTDKLHRKMICTCMIRIRKKDVLKQLPDKQRIVIPLEIEKRKDYEKAKDDFIKFLTQINPAKAERAAKAQALVKIGYLKQLAASLKMKYVLEWIDDFLEESDEKLIVFGIHKEIIKKLEDRYKHICVVVDGEVVGKDRQIAVNQFQTNSKVRLFIGNINAAGVGLTLTAASTVATIELEWNAAKHNQADDRAHRIGSKGLVTCYYLIAKDTIESKLLKLIQESQKVFDAVLEGNANFDNFSLHDELMKELLKEKE